MALFHRRQNFRFNATTGVSQAPTCLSVAWGKITGIGRLSALYSGSLYLFASAVLTNLLGFAFWTLAARHYGTSAIGLNSAVIATVSYLALVSTLGLHFGLIRFYPEVKDKVRFVNTYFTVAGLLGIVIPLIFVASIRLWSPTLVHMQHSVSFLSLVLLFAMLNTISPVVDAVLIANRGARYVLYKGLVFQCLKIGLVVALAMAFMTLGITIAWGIALLVALLVVGFVMLPKVIKGYKPIPVLALGLLKGTVSYSGGNYLSALLATAPVLLLPIVVVNILGVEANAYFYIAWMVANAVYIIPSSVSYILFSEGSADEGSLRGNVRRAYKLSFLFILPAILLLLLGGKWILGLFGMEYATESLQLLKVLALASIPLVFTFILTSILRVTKELKKLIAIWAIIAVGTIGGSYLLVPLYGIVGIGYAWLVANLAIQPFQVSVTRRLKITGGRGFLEAILPQKILNIFPPGTLMRFIVVGGTGGLVGLGVLYGLTDGVGLHYLVSAVGSWLITLGVVYAGNSKWTFGFFPGMKGFSRFLVSNLATAAIGFSLYALFTSVFDIWYMASSVLSTACVTLINWVSSKYWIWRRK